MNPQEVLHLSSKFPSLSSKAVLKAKKMSHLSQPCADFLLTGSCALPGFELERVRRAVCGHYSTLF